MSCSLRFTDDMEPYYQSQFLKELGFLTRLTFHKNLINFYGFCQSDNWLYLLFEETHKSLKEVLLDSRISPATNPNSFSSLSELFVLQILCELSAAMETLNNQSVCIFFDLSLCVLQWSQSEPESTLENSVGCQVDFWPLLRTLYLEYQLNNSV